MRSATKLAAGPSGYTETRPSSETTADENPRGSRWELQHADAAAQRRLAAQLRCCIRDKLAAPAEPNPAQRMVARTTARAV